MSVSAHYSPENFEAKEFQGDSRQARLEGSGVPGGMPDEKFEFRDS